MTYTPEIIEAYDKAEEAIEKLLEVFKTFHQGEFMTGWTIVVSGVRMLNDEEKNETNNEHLEDIEDHIPTDDQNMVARYTCFRRRGQDPTMTRGMAEEFLDMIRS